MIAEAIPKAADLATKADIQALSLEIKGLEARLLRWTVTLFMPLWLGVFGIIITLLVQG